MKLDPNIRRRFTGPLVRWYRKTGRDLPWRKTADPYAIWVSEIMLQQTQVATVIPYFHRFLSAFPTIDRLAAASLEKVLKLWQGLGYYARARHLHTAAQTVVDRFGGKIPPEFKSLLALPGIGRSTAGAILTLAYGQRHPILDGNVRRVLCRYLAIQENPRDKIVEDHLWDISAKLLPKKDPGFFLQGIMDLGATLCKPKQPDCTMCPVKSGCLAYRNDLQDVLPLKNVRKIIPHFDHVAGVILYKDQVLIRRRPLKGLLAGLWEFPGNRIDSLSRQAISGKTLEAFFKRECNLNCASFRSWMTIKHAFTHFKMTLHVFQSHTRKNGKRAKPFKWVRRDALADYPFSTAHQKIVMKLTE